MYHLQEVSEGGDEVLGHGQVDGRPVLRLSSFFPQHLQPASQLRLNLLVVKHIQSHN